MLRLLLCLLASTLPAHDANPREALRPVRQGVVAMPFQHHFETCSMPNSPPAYEVRMHEDGRVLLHVAAGSPARNRANAVAAFEACLRRFGQQR
jgi:hypothetical protein